jgi:hypothetical protein
MIWDLHWFCCDQVSRIHLNNHVKQWVFVSIEYTMSMFEEPSKKMYIFFYCGVWIAETVKMWFLSLCIQLEVFDQVEHQLPVWVQKRLPIFWIEGIELWVQYHLLRQNQWKKCFVKKSNFIAKLFTNIVQVQQIATTLKFPSQSHIYF